MMNILYKELSYQVVGAAMEVHTVLGSGFLEAIYQKALERELSLRSIPYEAQKPIEVAYKGAVIADYLPDLVVDDKIILELKAVDALHSIHESQTISYLNASGLKLGILMNFGESRLKTKRIVV